MKIYITVQETQAQPAVTLAMNTRLQTTKHSSVPNFPHYQPDCKGDVHSDAIPVFASMGIAPGYKSRLDWGTSHLIKTSYAKSSMP